MIPIAVPIIGKEECDAVLRVLESGVLTGGPVVEEFERALASYCGYKYAVAVSSGTAALHIINLGLEIQFPDIVIVPDFTFISTANAVSYVGAKPYLTDVFDDTFNIDIKKAPKKAKAIIGVSLYGQAYNIDQVKEFAEENHMHLISDNCQALGTEWKGKRNFGDDSMAVSFYPTKNMTTGEGGAILTDNEGLAEQYKILRNVGRKDKYNYIRIGYNLRLSSLHAAIGIEQLKKIDLFTKARRENATILNELLRDIPEVQIPYEDVHVKHVYNQYTIKVPEQKRELLQKYLKLHNIDSSVYYEKPLSELKIFSKMRSTNNVIATSLSRRVLSIPVHPRVSKDDLIFIAEKIDEFFKRNR